MSSSVSQQQQQQQQQQKQKQAATLTTAEEEALKRNTDCVYFLASPLTCKKGNECEYRHSEYARVNPRDCYFWLNGNCLNPKCGFRHPPLDGLLGNQGVGSTNSSAQQSHAVSAHAHHNVGKQGVPCVFFQKGMCVKGDRCGFLHVTNPAANKTQHLTETSRAAEPQSFKKPSTGLDKCIERKKLSPANFSKAVKGHADTGVAPNVQDTGPGDGRGIEMYVPQHVGYEPVLQKNIVGHSTQLLQTHGSDDNNSFHNGKDADDVWRESSPGFDVLVDSELRDSEYYHGEDQYGRRVQEGINSVNEYDPDFNAMVDADGEVFRDPRGYNSSDHVRAWGQHRTSSERGEHLERRAYSKDERSDYIAESDLRYRLSKHRRVSGLRSGVSHEYAPNVSDEQIFMDTHRDALQGSSISSRLQGRIKLPGRVNGADTHVERGTQRGRIRSELSSERHRTPYQSRLRDRIKGRLDDNCGDQDRGFQAPWARKREMVDEQNSEFAAPKSLAELKSEKEESKAQPSLRKRKSLEDHHHPHHPQQSGGSFEAPLPLSEILKRKRAAAASVVGGSNKHGTSRETKVKQNPVSTVSKEESSEEPKFAIEDKIEVGDRQSSEMKQSVEAETEGMMMGEGAEDDQVYEGDDQNVEYYYYEEGYEEDGEYNYEEGENVEGEEEYVEEEGADGPGGGGGEDEGVNDSATKIDVTLP